MLVPITKPFENYCYSSVNFICVFNSRVWYKWFYLIVCVFLSCIFLTLALKGQGSWLRAEMPDTEWAVQYFVERAGEISPGVRRGGYTQHWLTGEKLAQQLQQPAAPGRKKWVKHFSNRWGCIFCHMNHRHFRMLWAVFITPF